MSQHGQSEEDIKMEKTMKEIADMLANNLDSEILNFIGVDTRCPKCLAKDKEIKIISAEEASTISSNTSIADDRINQTKEIDLLIRAAIARGKSAIIYDDFMFEEVLNHIRKLGYDVGSDISMYGCQLTYRPPFKISWERNNV